MQRFKSSFGVSFFIRSRLATTSYLRQKGKASTDTREANSKRYILYLFNYLLLLFIYLFIYLILPKGLSTLRLALDYFI